ncbi:purine-nucleoside phosphorylase [Lacrimispora saccharolytica]|uniref:Purine nucleoside phosphorylase DeoD-type n=1 Tax=Lacrimispora saccharolytica (strain ATCC 35040 / DSM 2544 / NRCC 2533 / WM1) TaxID=610130 RepID=D9RAK0_LACSW|nr:purine-nucleoside phosphorylase [Lacrimispora saccharolytica]ADL04278.1 purine nucleoside phosphorylase [[Clostridium] saccharolyticum WM1]QRV21446.1 purine-nucleoside phosphorylase [Lacrimispora saccharolytica]
MEMTPTAHNGANKGEIAKTVLMPGDPLRAKYIAETYLENPVKVTSVRNMLGFTGTYKGKELSVMGGGMGMPSMGIYSYELYHFYDVDQIIRIGSAGALQDHVKLMDVVIAMGACTDSNYAYQYGLPGTFAPTADYELLVKAVKAAEKQGTKVVVGNVLSSDIFYHHDSGVNDKWRSMGVLAVEMETAALYMNAAAAGKKALCLLTISDLIYGEEKLSALERQLGFGKMMEIALEL